MKTVVINQKHGEDFFLTNPLFNSNTIYTNSDLKKTHAESGVLANVYTFDDEYELELLAPGLEKNDIDIHVDYNNVMTVSAETDNEEKEEKGNCQRQEFVNKGFKRSFQLPEDAISDDITAIYRNGVISLFIPKKEDFKIQETTEIFTS